MKALLRPWFEHLVSDCQTILDNTKGQVGEILYRAKHALGKRVLEEKQLDNHGQQELADRLGCSQDTISKAKRFAEDYPDIDSYLFSHIKDGVFKLPSWRSQANSLLPRHASRRQSSITVGQKLRQEGIIEDDFRNNDLNENSVNLILTDPPYGEEYLSLWDDLGSLAAKTLVPGGWLVTMSGQAHLPRVLDSLSNHLIYHWTIALKLGPEHSKMFGRHIYNWWKPVLVFFKPPLQERWVKDFLEGAGPEKNLHRWQQNLSDTRTLLEWFSEPDDIVLDPMAGSGTIVEACHQDPKRRCIAYEIQKVPA